MTTEMPRFWLSLFLLPFGLLLAKGVLVGALMLGPDNHPTLTTQAAEVTKPVALEVTQEGTGPVKGPF